jgi:hypothetical protein
MPSLCLIAMDVPTRRGGNPAGGSIEPAKERLLIERFTVASVSRKSTKMKEKVIALDGAEETREEPLPSTAAS